MTVRKQAYQIQQGLQEFHGWLTKTLQSFNKTPVANSAFKQCLQFKEKYMYVYINKSYAALY